VAGKELPFARYCVICGASPEIRNPADYLANAFKVEFLFSRRGSHVKVSWGAILPRAFHGFFGDFPAGCPGIAAFGFASHADGQVAPTQRHNPDKAFFPGNKPVGGDYAGKGSIPQNRNPRQPLGYAFEHCALIIGDAGIGKRHFNVLKPVFRFFRSFFRIS